MTVVISYSQWGRGISCSSSATCIYHYCLRVATIIVGIHALLSLIYRIITIFTSSLYICLCTCIATSITICNSNPTYVVVHVLLHILPYAAVASTFVYVHLLLHILPYASVALPTWLYMYCFIYYHMQQ